MSKGTTKRLELAIEFSSYKELKSALEFMTGCMSNGMKQDRLNIYNCFLDFVVDPVEESEYTEQFINGQLCRVFKSKM
jgi:hypothetical protein